MLCFQCAHNQMEKKETKYGCSCCKYEIDTSNVSELLEGLKKEHIATKTATTLQEIENLGVAFWIFLLEQPHTEIQKYAWWKLITADARKYFPLLISNRKLEYAFWYFKIKKDKINTSELISLLLENANELQTVKNIYLSLREIKICPKRVSLALITVYKNTLENKIKIFALEAILRDGVPFEAILKEIRRIIKKAYEYNKNTPLEKEYAVEILVKFAATSEKAFSFLVDLCEEHYDLEKHIPRVLKAGKFSTFLSLLQILLQMLEKFKFGDEVAWKIGHSITFFASKVNKRELEILEKIVEHLIFVDRYELTRWALARICLHLPQIQEFCLETLFDPSQWLKPKHYRIDYNKIKRENILWALKKVPANSSKLIFLMLKFASCHTEEFKRKAALSLEDSELVINVISKDIQKVQQHFAKKLALEIPNEPLRLLEVLLLSGLTEKSVKEFVYKNIGKPPVLFKEPEVDVDIEQEMDIPFAPIKELKLPDLKLPGLLNPPKDPIAKPSLAQDLALSRLQLSRIFSLGDFSLEKCSKNKLSPTFLLELVLETRGHLDELKRDLAFLNTKEINKTLFSLFIDLLKSILIAPIMILVFPFMFIAVLLELHTLAFRMKYSRFEIEQMYIDFVMSQQLLQRLLAKKCQKEYDLDTSKLKKNWELEVYEGELLLERGLDEKLIRKDMENMEGNIHNARLSVQRLIQVLCNPERFIDPQKWTTIELICEVSKMQKMGKYYSQHVLELEKRLTQEVEKVLQEKGTIADYKEQKCRLEEAKNRRFCYRLSRKLMKNYA